MTTSTGAASPPARLPAIIRVGALAALLLFVGRPSEAADAPRLVVVLYPSDNDGRPGNRAVDQGIRSTFASGPVGSVEVHNEYLDVSRFPDAGYQEHLAEFLRQKYAGQKVDLVIAGHVVGPRFRRQVP